MDKILIADDNVQITKILSEFAKKDGYEPVVAHDGEEAVQYFRKEHFEMILLDVMMPKKDGFEVCREIRKVSNIPIIMITARGEDFERIMGLDIGADDYIVKPFSGDEVMARVRAVLRRLDRTSNQIRDTLSYDNLAVCLENGMVSVDGQQIVLTKKELEILWLLLENKEKIFSRDNLLDSLWGYDYYGDNRTVDSHIKRLRAKLDSVPHPNWQIKTIWGMGYKFEGIENEV
ncbi:MAG: response regulator transcription factor [Lachnospiraceae bacterium]|jgi:DNA-binding response OmpR family regulator|nr:response regulator transcription factor [Lachnospiraceae bacterium]